MIERSGKSVSEDLELWDYNDVIRVILAGLKGKKIEEKVYVMLYRAYLKTLKTYRVHNVTSCPVVSWVQRK